MPPAVGGAKIPGNDPRIPSPETQGTGKDSGEPNQSRCFPIISSKTANIQDSWIYCPFPTAPCGQRSLFVKPGVTQNSMGWKTELLIWGPGVDEGKRIKRVIWVKRLVVVYWGGRYMKGDHENFHRICSTVKEWE